jgi:hypothetical protein
VKESAFVKILLVNELGQTVAQVNDVEKYDGSLAGHTAGLLDLLEVLIASAQPAQGGVAALAEARTGGEQYGESPR